MKKQYKKPITESVKVNLYNSILVDDPPIIITSHDVTNEGLGKENNLLFEDDAFGDIWGTDEDPNDLWGDN